MNVKLWKNGSILSTCIRKFNNDHLSTSNATCIYLLYLNCGID